MESYIQHFVVDQRTQTISIDVVEDNVPRRRVYRMMGTTYERIAAEKEVRDRRGRIIG